MVRLMLVLAPVMCILSGIGASSMLSTYMKQYLEGSSKVPEKKLKKNESSKSMKSEVSGLLNKIILNLVLINFLFRLLLHL